MRHVRTEPSSVLLLYHRPASLWFRDAATIVEQVGAVVRHSRFAVHPFNTDLGFPTGLRGLDVGAVVMHYSLFGSQPYLLDDRLLEWLDRSRAYKVCFFSDEHAHCRRRRAFIDGHRIDCVFYHVEPRYVDAVYGRCGGRPRVEFNLPGYVTHEVRAAAARLSRPDADRRVDVGYRGRVLPAWMGRGAREYWQIASEVALRADGRLVIDVDVREEARLYGKAWYRFLGDCRSTLGVESGTSYMDLDDEVLAEHLGGGDRDGGAQPGAAPTALDRWEGNVPYRTIATRHFEAAALRTCQILFEGSYSGVLRPMVHYLPLRKDFGNLEDILRWQADARIRREIADNAHRDLVASGSFDAARLVEHVDRTLLDAGARPRPDAGNALPAVLTRHTLRHRPAVELRRRPAMAGARVYRRAPEPVLRRLRAAKARIAGTPV